jgi:hypothetical protein
MQAVSDKRSSWSFPPRNQKPIYRSDLDEVMLGNPAIRNDSGPVAFRPHFPMGLALSETFL